MLNSALKKLVKRFNPKGQTDPSEKIYVAAFGKHPGWDDHIDDIGIETDTLVTVKRLLYVKGIGGNIDSGSWEKLQGDRLTEEFNHIFVWCIDRSVVVGRLWSSQDGKGRKSYPMVVCVQCHQLPLEWVLENILPNLQKIEEASVATSSADEVLMTIETAQARFRRLAQQCPSSAASPVVHPDALAKLTKCPEMGVNHEGLLRILYHIEREATHYQSGSAGSGKGLRPTLVRIPASSQAIQESAILWISFLLTKFGKKAAVLILMQAGKPWLDIVLGEPTDMQLYCLRASIDVIPLTSNIPYNLDSEFIDRANKLIDDSRSCNTRSVSGNLLTTSRKIKPQNPK